MALYIGSSRKQKINSSNGGSFRLHIPSSSTITNEIRLLSSDNYILKDFDGLYLIIKEDK